MSKPTMSHPDFLRVQSLAQDAITQVISTHESGDGPSIICANHVIAVLKEPALLWLECPADQKVLLLDISPDIYFETENMVGTQGILIRLNEIRDAELSLRLGDAAAYVVKSLPPKYQTPYETLMSIQCIGVGMDVSTTLTCQCGQFHLEVIGDSLLSAQCHCNSCRRAGTELALHGPARGLTEDNGGTNYTLYRKDRIRFPDSLTNLHAYRLSPTAPTRRVLTRCCNSPVFVEFSGGHWLSIYQSMWPMSQRERPALRTQTADAPPDTKFDLSIPAGAWETTKFYARLAAAWAAMGFRTPRYTIAECQECAPNVLATEASARSATLPGQ